MSGVTEQQVPEGYKQTEIGVIPNDWDICKLGNQSPFIGSGKTNTNNKGDYPLYGSTGKIGTCEHPEYEGDAILVARVGANAGRLNFITGKYGVSDNTIIVRIQKSSNIDYFKYQLVKRNLNSLVFGSGQPLITGSQLKALLVPVPLKPEQTAIADALSDVDGLIGSLEKLIAKKRAIKTAAMQQLLTGKKRLPPFDQTHTGYKQTELGQIPNDWEVIEIGKSLSIRHGRDQKQVEKEDGLYPILGTGGEIGRTNIPIYDKPCVLIGRKGTINKPVYMDSPFWTVDTLFYSEVENKYSAKFIFYKFCQIDWMSYNEASGVPSLNASTIESVLQAFPAGKEEQIIIANVLSDMDKDIDSLKQRLNKNQQLKQGMMQELLTGKTRLVDRSELIVESAELSTSLNDNLGRVESE